MATNPLDFVQQTRAEIGKVVWPTRREVMLTTVMVLLLAALAAVFFSSWTSADPLGPRRGSCRLFGG